MTNSKGAYTYQGIVLICRYVGYRLIAQGSAEELLVHVKLFGLVQHLLGDVKSVHVGVAEILQDSAHDASARTSVEDPKLCRVAAESFTQYLVEDRSAGFVSYITCFTCDLKTE